MGQPNAVGRIDIERLRLGGAFVTGSGVTHVAYAHVAAQFQHMTLLEDIAHRFNTELAGVPCIGDSLRDLQAAAAVGAKAILVLTGKGKQTAAKGGLPPHTQTFADLNEAVKSITQ